MGMPLPKDRFTVDALETMPDDGRRYELIDGVLFVTPAPSRLHQRAQIAFVFRLLPYARALGLELLVAPTDVRASDSTQTQPDILVLPLWFAGRDTTRWEQMSRLWLALEVLSPATQHADREIKREVYLGNGVREYWIVDTAARCVERWTAATGTPVVERASLTWQPVSAAEPLVMDLVTLFHEVHLDA
jgi:Uma2 family endonuclease